MHTRGSLSRLRGGDSRSSRWLTPANLHCRNSTWNHRGFTVVGLRIQGGQGGSRRRVADFLRGARPRLHPAGRVREIPLSPDRGKARIWKNNPGSSVSDRGRFFGREMPLHNLVREQARTAFRGEQAWLEPRRYRHFGACSARAQSRPFSVANPCALVRS